MKKKKTSTIPFILLLLYETFKDHNKLKSLLFKIFLVHKKEDEKGEDGLIWNGSDAKIPFRRFIWQM